MEADMKALRKYKDAIIKKNDKYFNDVSTSEYYTYLRNNGIEPQSYCVIL